MALITTLFFIRFKILNNIMEVICLALVYHHGTSSKGLLFDLRP